MASAAIGRVASMPHWPVLACPGSSCARPQAPHSALAPPHCLPADALQSEIHSLAAEATALAAAHGFALEEAADVAAAVSESAEALVPAAASMAAPESVDAASPAARAAEDVGSGKLCCFGGAMPQDGGEAVGPPPSTAAAADPEPAAAEAAAAAEYDAAPLEAGAAALDASGLLPDTGARHGGQVGAALGSPGLAPATEQPDAAAAAKVAPAPEPNEPPAEGGDSVLAGMELTGAAALAAAAAGSTPQPAKVVGEPDEVVVAAALTGSMAAGEAAAAPQRVDELLEGLSLSESEEEEHDHEEGGGA